MLGRGGQLIAFHSTQCDLRDVRSTLVATSTYGVGHDICATRVKLGGFLSVTARDKVQRCRNRFSGQLDLSIVFVFCLGVGGKFMQGLVDCTAL